MTDTVGPSETAPLSDEEADDLISEFYGAAVNHFNHHASKDFTEYDAHYQKQRAALKSAPLRRPEDA